MNTAQMLPVQPGERIAILDIWRGFALFGVLVVDLPGFASPYGLPGYVPPVAMLWYDSLARNLVAFLAEDKFYIMFSFLFGAGFSLQLARAEARGKEMRLFYPRRLWVLLGLGILHSVFLWTADILRIYALLGFLLLAFRKRSERTVLAWTGIFFLLWFALSILGHASRGGDTGIPGIDVVGMARAAYHSSSYIDVLIFQAISSPASLFITLLIRGPTVVALFLLGMLAGRSKLAEQLHKKRTMLQRIFFLGLIAGLAGNSLLLLPTRNPWLDALGATVGAPALASAYMSGLALLWLSRKGPRILEPLGKVGRMALSNYLLQSMICTLLFDGFGFALYEKVNRAGLLGIALLIYLAQIPLSVLWLSRFQFGPVEWLWRSLTYRQRQTLRRAK